METNEESESYGDRMRREARERARAKNAEYQARYRRRQKLIGHKQQNSFIDIDYKIKLKILAENYETTEREMLTTIIDYYYEMFG